MKNPRSVSKANRGLFCFRLAGAVTLISAAAAMAFVAARPSSAAAPKYDINTLAGKVASLRGTAGLQIRFSAFIEQEAEEAEGIPSPTAITPVHVLSSPLDGTTIVAPNVLVNQDTAAAPQNETAIAVDPNNPNRIVGGANDYVTRTWDCASSMERRVAHSVTVTRARTTRTMAVRPGAATATQTPTTHRLPTRAKSEPSFRVLSASSAASTTRAVIPRSRSTARATFTMRVLASTAPAHRTPWRLTRARSTEAAT